MNIGPSMSEEERSEPWPERDAVEHRQQWEAFSARWNAHREVVNGPLQIQRTQLDREPPFAVVSGEDDGQRVRVAMSRGDERAIFTRADGGGQVSMRQAADVLGVHAVELDRARAAIVDGLEQSERAAGRTPADRAPYAWVNMDSDLNERYDEALEQGYVMADQTLRGLGINPTPLAWSSEQLRPSADLDQLALTGRSATANVAALLENGDRTEDVMLAVEVLTANPWDRSALREGVEEQLYQRLEGMGLRAPAAQQRHAPYVRGRQGVDNAGEQIAALTAATELHSDSHRLRDGEFQIQADAILDRVDPVLDELFQGIQIDVTLRESSGKTVATVSDVEEGSDWRVIATPRDDGSLDYRTKDGNPLAFDHEVADVLRLGTADTRDMLRGLESGYRDASAATLAHRGDGAARQPSTTPEQTSVRARNADRMARQVPARIRAEEPGESLRRAAPRPSR